MLGRQTRDGIKLEADNSQPRPKIFCSRPWFRSTERLHLSSRSPYNFHEANNFNKKSSNSKTMAVPGQVRKPRSCIDLLSLDMVGQCKRTTSLARGCVRTANARHPAEQPRPGQRRRRRGCSFTASAPPGGSSWVRWFGDGVDQHGERALPPGGSAVAGAAATGTLDNSEHAPLCVAAAIYRHLFCTLSPSAAAACHPRGHGWF